MRTGIEPTRAPRGVSIPRKSDGQIYEEGERGKGVDSRLPRADSAVRCLAVLLKARRHESVVRRNSGGVRGAQITVLDVR